MRYGMFEKGGETFAGAVIGDAVVPLRAAMAEAPADLAALIAAGPAVQKAVAEACTAPGATALPLSGLRTLIPLPTPGKVICLGLNYAAHAKEGGHATPDYPSLFMRVTTSLIGPDEPMIVPSCSEKFDYEAELAVVIGTRCRHVAEADAGSVIFGYSCFNDGSVRDYQRKTAQWTAGKNFDATGAMGPFLVTADEVPPLARGLAIGTRLNGETMQASNTDNMLFDVPRTIAILSEIMTLEPGDVIATGTPEGVGHARTPQVWMRPGDRVEVEIAGIGVLANPIAAERA